LKKPTVLLVDDDPGLLQLLEIRLESFGYSTLSASSGSEALNLLETQKVQAVITDLRMEPMDGIELFTQVHDRWPGIPVIMLTAHGTIREAVDATLKGAFAFLTKPVNKDELQSVLKKAFGLYSLSEGEEILPIKGQIVTRSARMLELLEQAKLYAESDANILITGESGTGKELLSETVHRYSNRSDNPFVAINCSAIPSELLESELFGHIKGAFTGATQNRDGLFTSANGGTVLLDEIGDMPYLLQAKLLRVLQDSKVRPVGSRDNIDIDIRVISATHMNLEQAIRENRFREDLFYRLNVVHLHIPPLKQRLEDIPVLSELFLNDIATRSGKQPKRLSPQALSMLLAFDWPGNIRQLQNVMERVSALSRGQVISESLIRQALPASNAPKTHSFKDAKKNFERQYLVQLLTATQGNMTLAAELADKNRSAFHKLVKQHDIIPANFRYINIDD